MTIIPANPEQRETPEMAEPTDHSQGARLALRRYGHHALTHYFLVLVWIALIGLYSLVMPGKFFQATTFQAIFGSQSPLLFLALASLCTFVVGEFDLSIASVMGFAATIIPVLTTLHHVALIPAILIAIGGSVACGAVNAFFIVGLGVSALTVTLGTASLYIGLAELISSSNTVSVSSTAFVNATSTDVFGLPLMFYYGVAVVCAFAFFLGWTPTGRHIAFVGASREVARLAGIPVNRIRVASYMTGSLIAGISGVLLIGSVGGVDPTGSSQYLLPALAAAFLGAAVVKPGQFNPFGTFVGIYFLETGVIGLQILGASAWVTDAFYGAGLVTAVTLASIVGRRARTA
jgi:ribose transport system permease protein